jgi:hypothetical protein
LRQEIYPATKSSWIAAAALQPFRLRHLVQQSIYYMGFFVIDLFLKVEDTKVVEKRWLNVSDTVAPKKKKKRIPCRMNRPVFVFEFVTLQLNLQSTTVTAFLAAVRYTFRCSRHFSDVLSCRIGSNGPLYNALQKPWKYFPFVARTLETIYRSQNGSNRKMYIIFNKIHSSSS